MGDGVYMLRVNSNNRIFTKTIKTIHWNSDTINRVV
jgi:hypothetical protein